MDLSDEEDNFQHAPEISNHRHAPKGTSQRHDVHSDAASDLTAQSVPPAHIHGEARIVAPNVSKLSPHSAIEVRLQSATECVAVLCSVDVLKMRSGFFHDVLCEQESHTQATSHEHGGDVLPEMNPNVLWRPPIVVPEVSPFEAAAYLESLHEGRALFRGDWSFCWARLRYVTRCSSHLSTVLIIALLSRAEVQRYLGDRGLDAGVRRADRAPHQ
jgi:hypothetical protein